jgi:hypothetical protein
MLSKKLQQLTQIVGCVTIGLLAVYGLLMILSGSSPVWAAIGQAAPRLGTASSMPTTFNYQGFLRNPDGSLTTGSYTITARIYDLATQGTTLYSTTVPNVTVRDGLFNIVLGDDPPMSAEAFADVPRYIGISLNDDPELIPRQRLHAVPWALYATHAMTATTAETLVSDAEINGLTSTGDIRLQNAAGTKSIELRTSGTFLDIDTAGGDLYINTDHTTTRTIRLDGDVAWTGHLTSMVVGDEVHVDSPSSAVDLGDATNRICFLVGVNVNDVDSSDEWAGCFIDREADGHWWLTAWKVGDDDDAQCEARCLSW